MIPFQLIPADTSSTSALWDIHSIPFMSAMGRPGDLHLATLLLGLRSEVRGGFFSLVVWIWGFSFWGSRFFGFRARGYPRCCHEKPSLRCSGIRPVGLRFGLLDLVMHGASAMRVLESPLTFCMASYAQGETAWQAMPMISLHCKCGI